MKASRRVKTKKSTSSLVKCEGFAHCFLRFQWCIMNSCHKVVRSIRNTIFVRNAQNCGKTNHGFYTIITHQLTNQCLCVSFWPFNIFNSMAWCIMNSYHKDVRSTINTTLKLCADCGKQFVRNAQNYRKTKHGFCIMLTDQITHRCQCVSLWPKIKP